MSNEIVKFSNQFNNVALKKFDAVHLDVLMAIASRVREKGTATVEFSFEELRGLMRLRKNLTNRQLADKIVQTNARLLALNYMFEDSGKIIQFALFTRRLSAGELREQVRDLPQEPQIQEQPGYGYQPGFQQPQQWQQQPWN